MRISHRHNFIFLAYPRTASRTIRSLLDDAADLSGVHLSQVTAENPFHHHMTARAAKQAFDRLGWDWHSYHSFCVVRNPYARLLSLFKRRREKEDRWDARLHPVHNLTSWLFARLPARLAFNLFVLTRDPQRGVACSLPAFTFDAQGRNLVSGVLQFEYLDEQLPASLEILGLAVNAQELPKLNRSNDQSSYVGWYHPLTIRQVERNYAYTIEKFGYRFDGQPGV